MYLEHINKLILLQRVDNEINELKRQVEDAPKELAELEDAFKSIDDRLAQIKEKVDILESNLKRVEFEIDDDSAKIKKSKNKLMMVGNTKEYHAMMREMDSLEKLNRSRDEEKITLQEELARQEEARVALAAEAAEMATQLEEKRAGLAERLAQSQGRLDELTGERKGAGKIVPPPILGRYEFIRARLPNPVIVPVDQGVCGGCHIGIPPQSFIELQKGKQILSCPNCQRLIYWKDHHPDVVAEAAAAASEAAE